MGKIFSYLSRYLTSVLCIILLLIAQAYCDLSLPQYMSDIVDVGIQQGGIAHVSPDEMRKETWENLCLFLTEEEEGILKNSYQETEEGDRKSVV